MRQHSKPLNRRAWIEASLWNVAVADLPKVFPSSRDIEPQTSIKADEYSILVHCLVSAFLWIFKNYCSIHCGRCFFDWKVSAFPLYEPRQVMLWRSQRSVHLSSALLHLSGEACRLPGLVVKDHVTWHLPLNIVSPSTVSTQRTHSETNWGMMKRWPLSWEQVLG